MDNVLYIRLIYNGGTLKMIEVTCTDNGLIKPAEVIKQDSKHLKIMFEGTAMYVDLFREDLKKPYVGNKAGLEFTYLGD